MTGYLLVEMMLAVLLLLGTVSPVLADPLKVVTSFSILGDMARRVGGDQVLITTLVGPDGDAHVYEPTPADIRAVAQAGLLIVNGLGMEGWMDRLDKAAGYRGPVVVASTGVRVRHPKGGDGRTTDPHAWQDLSNGLIYVANIEAGLAAADPTHADTYHANAKSFSKELKELDSWVRAEIGSVPPGLRRVITSHDSFGYFGEAYGIRLLAPAGIGTEAEITARNLATLVTQIRTTRTRAIFLENMSDPRRIGQLEREAGARAGGTLYVDALSPAGGPAPDYIAMFRHNVPLLKDAMLRNGRTD
ncbi:MAG: metal ABC transporter substrate-binding protein [Alphaproteobacteria bacterium]